MPTKPYKILFVDDDEFIRKIYIDRLEASGLDVYGAPTAEEAKKLIETKPFDLICLDHILAEKSGLEVLMWIREVKKMTLPVIIFSASGNEKQIKDFMAAGATEYVQKDHVVPSELVDKIVKTIENHA